MDHDDVQIARQLAVLKSIVQEMNAAVLASLFGDETRFITDRRPHRPEQRQIGRSAVVRPRIDQRCPKDRRVPRFDPDRP